MRRARIAAVILGLGGWLLAVAAAAQSGRLEGRVTGPDGAPLPGIRVTVSEAQSSTVTDGGGRYGFNLAPGTYHVEWSAAGRRDSAEGVAVTAATVTRLDRRLDWTLSAAQTAVTAAGGRLQPAGEALATVEVVGPAELDRHAAAAPFPSLLLATAGLNVAQSGLYSYSVGAEGFNRYLASGVAVYVDGRDASMPFFGGQDWAAFPQPNFALAQVDVQLGGAASLRGADAASGVINVVTHRGGDHKVLANLSGGDLSSKAGDVSWGNHFGNGWGAQVTADARQSDNYAVSRNGQAEYSTPCTAAGQTDCLPQEAVGLPRNNDQNVMGSARLDRAFEDGGLFTVGGGYLQERGPVIDTDLGRLQIVNAERKWGTLSYDAEHWNVAGWYNGRDAGKETDLTTGENLALDSRTFQGLGQTSWGFAGDRLHLTAGAWYQDEQTDSEDKSGPLRPTLLLPTNQESLLFQRVRAGSEAAFAQLEWAAAPNLSLVAGGRYDSSALWSSQVSARLGLAYAFAPGQTLRLRYDRGFIAPTEEQLFLNADVAPAVNLSSLENLCAGAGVPCGFDLDFHPGQAPGPATTRVMAAGNSSLEPEHVSTVNAGYSGDFGNRVHLWVDAYWSQRTDVITDLIPELGTSLGRVNPAYAAYQPSPFLPPAVAAQVMAGLQNLLGPLFPYLTTNVDGTPIVVLQSETNYGTVDAYGADLGVRVTLPAGFLAGIEYSYLHSMARNAAPDLAFLLSANTPRNKGGVTLGYNAGRLNVAADYRWVQSFLWVSEPFVGQVPSYSLVDLAGRYRLTDHVAVGVDVNNLLDKVHYETFGGDLIGRRVLGSLTLEW